MKVKMFWPKCHFLNMKWQDEDARIDSFWVEFNYWEAEKLVFPYLGDEVKNKIIKDLKSRDQQKSIYFSDDKIYFLISKNLESIVLMPWFYPYSGQWNGYSPFEKIEAIEIKSLKELSYINISNS